MKKLNKYVLVVLNPRSTQEELIRNVKDAYDASFAAVVDAFDAFDAITSAAAFDAFDADAAVAAAEAAAAAVVDAKAKKYIDKFFEISGHNIQDYYDENEKINKDK